MAKLIYATPTSLDGYIADKNYDWAAFRESLRIAEVPDEDLDP